jgi:hypothetical protein
MSDNVLQLESLIELSELTTPVVCPPDLEISNDEFYKALRRTIEAHRLPVECADCSVQLQDAAPLSKRLLIGLPDGQIRHLRILVGFEKFGSLAYVDRKYILISPDLPPSLSASSDELPPRLTPSSPELPAPDPDPSPDYLKASYSTRPFRRYKSEAHEARCSKMEERRQERRKKIKERQEERGNLLSEWLAETYETVGQVHSNPSLIHFKDSVDTIIKVVISDLLEARGAQAKEMDERMRKEEELRERANEIKRKFF